MPDHYEATILADSINPAGNRITTFMLSYPHIIHKEVMTHRVFSRSFMSMRAVPPERPDSFIDQVENDPFVPEFHGRVTGMGTSGPLPENEAATARAQWLSARDAAVSATRNLALNDVAKSDVNPLLEPFLWMRGVITATEWDNFYALRDHDDARKEFRKLAGMMRAESNRWERVGLTDKLAPGQWHIPALTQEEAPDDIEDEDHEWWATVSAGRLARISFDRVHMCEPVEKSIERSERLISSGHMSPFEHQAMCLPAPLPVGNFIGWRQFRKNFKHEDNYAQMMA